MTDRELLAQLARLLAPLSAIEGDADSIRDMVTRYANPPLTLHNRVSLRMTKTQYTQLEALMKRINEHLKVDHAA